MEPRNFIQHEHLVTLRGEVPSRDYVLLSTGCESMFPGQVSRPPWSGSTLVCVISKQSCGQNTVVVSGANGVGGNDHQISGHR